MAGVTSAYHTFITCLPTDYINQQWILIQKNKQTDALICRGMVNVFKQVEIDIFIHMHTQTHTKNKRAHT